MLATWHQTDYVGCIGGMSPDEHLAFDPMAFTLYRVEADYAIPRSDIAGPGWVCETYDLAVALAVELKETRKDLTNVNIKVRHYD